MFLKQKEVDIYTLLTLELGTDKDELIEVVLSNMRIHTNFFQAEINNNKRDIPKKLMDKSDELNQAIQFNTKEISQIEIQISQINEENLQEQAVFFKNYTMMNDCKLMEEFIRLESRKRSYCNIVKIIIPKKTKDLEIVCQPSEIRNKMVEQQS